MHKLGVKLTAGLAAAMAAVLLWLGRANLRVLRENLETTAVLSARSIADIIFRATHDSMMHNNREELVHIIHSIGAQTGVRKIRVFNKHGTIQLSTHSSEVGQMVDKRAEACYACHASDTPLEKPAAQHTYRFYRMGEERLIGLIRPIENEPACANAYCHAHPPSQRILGVLDVVLSLEPVDEVLAVHERRMRAQVLVSAGVLVLVGGLLVWLLISRPIRRLIAGVNRLAEGDLSWRFRVQRRDEIGALARAFDDMAEQVESANRTLEERIRRKTQELEAAQQKLIHTEKLASLGQLAAAVAHEINNPLAGIYTYARLLEKKAALQGPALEWVQTIQRESRRCGDIANSLLVFARKQPTQTAPCDLRTIVRYTLAVLEHKLQGAGIEIVQEIPELPRIPCDGSQIQQVLTAILVNAADAIGSQPGRRGRIVIRGGLTADGRVDIAISNNGPPIPQDVLPRIFEPFFSTKQAAAGVGLGLAVAYGIVQRHGGEIQVTSTEEETTFHVLLPTRETPASPTPESSDVRAEALHTDR